MDVFMAMVQLLRQAPLNVRSTICQLVNSLLHHTPEDILRISLVPGWEVFFLWLLTPHTQDQPRPLIKEEQTDAQPTSFDQTTPSNVQTTPTIARSNKDAPTPPNTLPLNPVGAGARANAKLLKATTPGSSRANAVSCSLDTPHSNNTTGTQNHTSLDIIANGHRSRSCAFVDENTAAPLDYVITEGELIDKHSQKKSRKKSLRVSTPWTYSGEEEGNEEVVRTVDIVTQTFRHILWNSTLDQSAWKVLE